ncbi:MAG: nitronate monooxygenase family protein [Caldisericota bacterium]|nr:nitronate monooxygenase family protein [Caldisericota bacterium]
MSYEAYKKIPVLKIGDLTANIPIVQGGMSVGISLSNLASAVANEGGIGVIGAAGIGMLEHDFRSNFEEANKRALKREIRKAKKRTNGIIGVNIMVALSDFSNLVRVAVEEGADLIFAGAGLPLKSLKEIMDTVNEIKTKFVPIVSSSRAAALIFNYWAKHYNEVPDAVVVEGPMAGGHLGFAKKQINDKNYSLEKILPKVISVVKSFAKRFNKDIPVVAAGGIYTGADIHKFMQLGAEGVQMATRFVGTDECDASDEFKDVYIKCKREDIIIIDSPVGLPGRAIRNRFLEGVAMGKKQPFTCTYKCLKTCDYKKVPYCIAFALTNAKKGFLENGFAFSGANAWRVNKIVSVKELFASLIKEYQEAAAQ